MDFFHAASDANSATHRLHLMGYGQSNGIGIGAGSTILTGTQPFTNEKFNTGIRGRAIEGGTYTSFVPLTETVSRRTIGETGFAAAANYFVAKMASWAAYPNQGIRILASTGGRSGAGMAKMSKGTFRYNDMIEMVQAGHDLSAATGETYAYLCTCMVHGETDHANRTPREAYAAALRKMAVDIATDVSAITGQALVPPFLATQMAQHLFYFDRDGRPVASRPEIALATRDAIGDDLFVVMPRYVEDFNRDQIHVTNESHKMRGLYFGRALANIMLARIARTPVPPVAVDLKAATWQDKVIDLQFHVPVPPLEFDTSWVADTTNKGFDLWSADGTTLLDIIDTVTVAGPDRVRIELDEVPPSGARLSHAFGRPGIERTSGRNTGPRGNLRDHAGDADNYVDNSGVTRYLHNYALIFETVKP